MTIFKIVADQRILPSRYVHARLFVGPDREHLQLTGVAKFYPEEWADILRTNGSVVTVEGKGRLEIIAEEVEVRAEEVEG